MYVQIRNGGNVIGESKLKEVFVKSDSFQLVETYNDYSRCSFTMIDYDNVLVYPIVRGSRVAVYDIDTDLLIYNGYVDTYEVLSVSGEGIHTLSLSTIGNEYLLEAKLYSKKYIDTPIKNIVYDIATKKTAGTIELGNNSLNEKVSIEFENENLVKCLNKLAEQTDCYWYIDSERKVHFIKNNSVIKNIELTADDVYGKSLSYNRKNPKYVSAVELSNYFRVGKEKTERIYSYDNKRKFELSNTFYHAPVVELIGYNGQVEQVYEVGPKRDQSVVDEVLLSDIDIDYDDIYDEDDFSSYFDDIDSDDGQYDIYFEPGDKYIYMSNRLPVVPYQKSLRVTYKPIFKKAYLHVDMDEFNKHKNVTEYVGQVTMIYEEPVIGEEDAILICQTIIDNHKVDTVEISFDSEIGGIEKGDVVTLNISEYDISGKYTTQKIEKKKFNGNYLYSYTFFTGTPDKDWTKFFYDNGVDMSSLNTVGFNSSVLNTGSMYDFTSQKGNYDLPYAGASGDDLESVNKYEPYARFNFVDEIPSEEYKENMRIGDHYILKYNTDL